MSHYHLDHRTIICLEGEAPIGFLQDILTADIASLGANEMRQSCLLSPQGRILIEMNIFIPEQKSAAEQLYIACDEGQADELIKKLKLYRLRRKITIERCDDYSLIASDEAPDLDGLMVCAPDKRAPNRGYLAIIKRDATPALTLADKARYTAHRLLDAIPEGPEELTPNRALMLEAGLDIFAAVDFKKGCYIGQEVTARTRWRGLVKRRLVPVKAANLSIGTPLIQDEKDIGTILATAPLDDEMVGLASLRLAAIHEAEDGALILCDEAPITLAIPDHLRPLPKPEDK